MDRVEIQAQAGMRRDETVAAIIQAGGSLIETVPLADPADPHVVVAYQVQASASDLATLARVQAVQDATERDDTTALIPWTPEPTPDEPDWEDWL